VGVDLAFHHGDDVLIVDVVQIGESEFLLTIIGVKVRGIVVVPRSFIVSVTPNTIRLLNIVKTCSLIQLKLDWLQN
jgi:hypothetical protein